jgi:nitric oxide dioxygenase
MLPATPVGYLPFFHTLHQLLTELYQRYSLSDSPSPDIFRITTKRERGIKVVREDGTIDDSQYLHPGWVSNVMHDVLKVGDTVEVGYPFGEYWLDTTTTSPVVLISAGVGVTPVMAMLNNIVKPAVETENVRPKREVSWIHSVRSAKDHAFKDHVASLASAHPEHIHTTVFYSVTEGATKDVDYDIEGRMDLSKVPTGSLLLDKKDAQY